MSAVLGFPLVLLAGLVLLVVLGFAAGLGELLWVAVLVTAGAGLWAVWGRARAVTADAGRLASGGTREPDDGQARRCGTCHAAVVEEDRRFCPRCGARLGWG
jgi:uncharacterized paraquat-inducible protein A